MTPDRPLRVVLLGEIALSHGLLLDRLAEGLAAHPGVEVEVLRIPRPSRVEAHFLRRVPPLRGFDLQPLRWRLRYSLHGLRKLRAHVGRCDVVLVNTQSCALLLQRTMRRVPVVLSVDMTGRQYDATGYRGLDRRERELADVPLERLERRALRGAAAVIAWTTWTARSVREDYGVPGERVHAVHPGIDVDAWRAPRAPASPAGRLRVLFVGNEAERKGLPDLLAARRLAGAEVELVLVTADPVEPEPGVTVHEGFPPGSDGLRRAFAEADVLALPTRADAVPWVVLEAMAAGTPVVATDVGAIAEVVGPAGTIVAPGDPAALARALDALAADPARRAELGRLGRERAAATYSVAASLPRIVEVLQASATVAR